MSSADPKFVTYNDFCEALPHPIPRSHVLRLSKVGRFPEFVRPAGLQSEPLFLEADIIGWLREKYGKLLPCYCERIEHEGLAGARRPLHAESL
jgi:hypothetical protein